MNEIKKITVKTLPKIKKILKDNDSYGSGEINSIKLIDNKIEIDFGYNNIAHSLILSKPVINKLDLSLNSYESHTIDNIEIKDKNELQIDLDYSDEINVKFENIEFTYDDIENSIYCFVSVKYNEENSNTYYYLSDIEDLKIGDYVWVDARDDKKVAIIDRIEFIKYCDAPFPIFKTKKLLKKASYKEYCINHGIMDFEPLYNFENEEQLLKNCKKMPQIKAHSLKWIEPKKNSPKPGYYKYSKELDLWLESVEELEIYDENFEKNYKFIKTKDLNEMNIYELITYLSYILNTISNDKDLIAESLENGMLENLSKLIRNYK